MNDSFRAVFTVEPESELPDFADRTNVLLDPQPDDLFTEIDVREHLEKLVPEKSAGPDGIHPRVLKTCASCLALPLTTIFRRSLKEGRVPEHFRRANVTPIFKKGCRTNALNYRPISLTSVPCKVMEEIIHSAILEHLTTEKLIAPEQHGFLPGKSCTSNLLESYEIMCEALENKEPMDIVYTDISKAFDTVPHNRLLLKLRAYGIRGKLLDWTRDWLSRRAQRVVLDEHTAEWSNVLSGVPQGSVLGPLLFLLYINDIVDVTVNPIRLYADDTKILGRARTEQERDQLQADINACVEWTRKWLMCFNVAKCKVMHVGWGLAMSERIYTMTDESGAARELETTQVERDLGVLVSSDLKMGAQCKAAAAKARWVFAMLKRAFSSRSRRLWEILWKTHIRPHIEHAIQAWSPYLKCDINMLERVQRVVTKHIDGMRGLSYEQRLRELGWTTLETRRVRGDLIFTYQTLHNNALTSLSTWNWAQPITLVGGPASSVRANEMRLNPPLRYRCKQRENFITSRVAAPLRNLPFDMMSAPSVNALKNAFDKPSTGHV